MKTPSTPGDLGDRLDLLHRLARLDLHQHADFIVRFAEIAGHAAVARRARGDRHAADAVRRIARGGDRALGFLGVLHIGKQQRLRADVEAALGEHHVVPGRPHDRRRGAALQGLELCDQVRDFVGRMLGVEQDPVETGIADELGGDVAAQARPQADLQFAGGDRVLEGVVLEFAA